MGREPKLLGDDVKYWLDTEYLARPFALELVSIALVAEDGREFYAESSEVDWSKASRWAIDNVKPQLDGHPTPLEDIGYSLKRFVGDDEKPVFWGYYAAFDWVAFVGLFGSLGELPFGFPQACMDIKQWAVTLGSPKLPPQPKGRHHALADARWTRDAWNHLADFERRHLAFKRLA